MSKIIPQIGFCSWSANPENPQKLAFIAQKLDIPSIQLALVPLLDHPKIWMDTGRLLREQGIKILSGMMNTRQEDYSSLKSIAQTGGVRPDETWPENQEIARRVAELAATLELSLVTFHAGFLPESPDDPQRKKMLDRLATIAEIFTSQGITLALETGQETASSLNNFLAGVNLPGIGVNFDPGNMILYGKGDPIDALKMLAPHILQIHIKDALPTDQPGTWGQEVPVGEGVVDWSVFFASALSLPHPINYIIERESGNDRLRDIRQAARLVERHIKQEAAL